MIKKISKYLLIVTMLLALVAQPLHGLASETKTVYYVSLGDSLAAGQTPYGKLGKGYPDFIAEYFQGAGVLKAFVKDYGVSGYTSKNVLDDITNNVKKGENAGIQAEIAAATHITLDVGANDLLRQLKIDRSNGTVSYDEKQVQIAFLQLQDNLAKTMLAIKGINPKAKVYLMGYYNPMPHLPANQQPLLETTMTILNKMLEQIAVQSGAVYVATDKTIAGNIAFLPNPMDVHVSEEGYKAIAASFWTVMKPESQPAPGEDKETPVVYWEGMILKKGQIGKVTVQKPINLWERTSGKLKFVRVLKPGEAYRVYNFDSKFGGQFGLGGGFFITKMITHVKYSTPSKQKWQRVNN